MENVITVACVLRSGAEYEPKHVVGLFEQLKRHCAAPFRLVCLTDMPFNHPEIFCEPLINGWPGWWSKLELFHVFCKGATFYMDLDTMIVVDVTDILMPRHGFWGLRDFNAPSKFASGLMAWDGNHSYLYARFRVDPERHMMAHTSSASWGDQGFIESSLRVPPIAFQDHFPGRIVSFKNDVASGGMLRTRPSIICFHGQPRPWDVVRGWPEFHFARI